MFSKYASIKETNETKVMAILEALRIYLSFLSIYDKLIDESDSSNAISWVSYSNEGPWNLHFNL